MVLFEMDGAVWAFLYLVIYPVIIGAWKTSAEERKQVQELRRTPGIHYHNKRHMQPMEKRPTSARRDMRKKPTGHLTPLQEDDIDNDEVVSVAIGPPPMRPKYEKWKSKLVNNTAVPNPPTQQAAVNLVKDVLVELGRDFLTRQINENFVFGQYVGNAMKNLTNELRLKMQHEILELVVKYQRINAGDFKSEDTKFTTVYKDLKGDRRTMGNDTDENWPDFSNLAKIVGK